MSVSPCAEVLIVLEVCSQSSVAVRPYAHAYDSITVYGSPVGPGISVAGKRHSVILSGKTPRKLVGSRGCSLCRRRFWSNLELAATELPDAILFPVQIRCLELLVLVSGDIWRVSVLLLLLDTVYDTVSWFPYSWLVPVRLLETVQLVGSRTFTGNSTVGWFPYVYWKQYSSTVTGDPCMEKLFGAEMSMDMEIQSVSETQYSESSVVDSGTLTVPGLQDIRACGITREALTPLKLQLTPSMQTHTGLELEVQKGEGLEVYRSWQYCVQNWMNVSEKIVPVQGTD